MINLIENLPWYIQTPDDVDNHVFFPKDLIHKYGTKDFFPILEHYYLGKDISTKKVKQLIKKGLLKRKKINEEEVVGLLKRKIPQKWRLPTHKIFNCEWCQSESVCLHSHHYPKRKKNGGKITVHICASCHQEFHYLVDKLNFEISDELKKIFSEIEDAKENLKKFLNKKKNAAI